MGLFEGTQAEYYKGSNHGNYQFTSLEDIITQFEIAYVGENKIIPKIKRTDIAFYAQRALQELSFDTFKSVKSQQIDLPPSLTMILPHDYVNYTKLSWVDSAGIKHPLYPIKDTNNPFQILQKSNGEYDLDFVSSDFGVLANTNFSNSDIEEDWTVISPSALSLTGGSNGGMKIDGGKLKTSFHTQTGNSATNWTHVHTAYQAIDVSDITHLDMSADGVADTVVISVDRTSHTTYADDGSGNMVATDWTLVQNTAANQGVLRYGLSTQIPHNSHMNNSVNTTSGVWGDHVSHNIYVDGSASAPEHSSLGYVHQWSGFDLKTFNGEDSYMEWLGPTSVGSTSASKELNNIDVTNHSVVYAVIVSFMNITVPDTASMSRSFSLIDAIQANSIDNVLVTRTTEATVLRPSVGNEKYSSTWNSYKSSTPTENNNDDYEDDTYWLLNGNRYGLNPRFAQANGSFFIDQRLGKIHFSSNVSGKIVILDYISDTVGTDAEMQVHKFAEEAMYKWIAYAILSTSSLPIHQQLAPRFKKEKFASTRQAKLRLSNIKLEELTQILRGKSKQIKH
mgnify:FL=1